MSVPVRRLPVEDFSPKVELLRRQTAFVKRLADKRDLRAREAYRLVVASAYELKEAALKIKVGGARRQYLSDIGECLSTLATVKQRGFWVTGSGALAPSKHFGTVRSVESTPPPGSGKRR